ncbi:bifunctional phosphopantothenoylcysteine decarboxylase/phosphopantothenate--cysteine ligase CoaBC [Paenibacillus chartarius]|uniref:Coenzyme A biosynthesis bifunctional protein CoaBC n=1 Tax=Paenibacillus chartarius TaxID=747481 RepID=A0ABV6DU74_9BACL
MSSLRGKRIVLGVCGGIAAYKAAALCSKLTQAGADVRVIMTKSAVQFVAPLTFQTLSRHDVYVDTFDEKDASVVAHIDLADHADLFVIAPATANLIGKLALGLGDDMLSTTLLATTAPLFIAPAMNVHMYENAAVMKNMETLRQRGVRFIEPGVGQLACGYVGRGRLEEPEAILAALERYAGGAQLLAGRKVLITAGGTVERIDPVRFLTNDSSGRMGFAIAETARRMGAEVTLVAGRTEGPLPGGVNVIRVQSAQDMLEAVLAEAGSSDIIVKAAAVADYRPAMKADQKIKKSEHTMTLELVKNPDILQTLGSRKKDGQVLVGFAAETERLEEHAMDKLVRKNCDLLVANDVSKPGSGFGTETNEVRIFDRNGNVEALPLLHKLEVAERLLELAAARLRRSEAAEPPLEGS